MTSQEMIDLAKSKIDGAIQFSSAYHCLHSSFSLQIKKDYQRAKEMALKSLQYSIGVSHPDYPT